MKCGVQLLTVLEDCNAFTTESIEKVIKPATADNKVMLAVLFS